MNRVQFLIFAIMKSVRHPRTQIYYYYCPDCRLRFSTKETRCPQCHKKVGYSPELRQQSPMPWYGSVLIICIGIVCWILGALIDIPGLDEAGRALIYFPLGNLFGLTLLS
jgi:uncharacterized protein YlaI